MSFRSGAPTRRSCRDSGAFCVNGDALQGVETATTVRGTGGELQLTDGPFAETREHLGGYYIRSRSRTWTRRWSTRAVCRLYRPRRGRGQADLGYHAQMMEDAAATQVEG